MEPMTPSIQKNLFAENACANISSLEKKPENGGIPAMASVAIKNVNIGNWQFFSKSTHFTDILFAAQAMNNATCTKE